MPRRQGSLLSEVPRGQRDSRGEELGQEIRDRSERWLVLETQVGERGAVEPLVWRVPVERAVTSLEPS